MTESKAKIAWGDVMIVPGTSTHSKFIQMPAYFKPLPSSLHEERRDSFCSRTSGIALGIDQKGGR